MSISQFAVAISLFPCRLRLALAFSESHFQQQILISPPFCLNERPSIGRISGVRGSEFLWHSLERGSEMSPDLSKVGQRRLRSSEMYCGGKKVTGAQHSPHGAENFLEYVSREPCFFLRLNLCIRNTYFSVSTELASEVSLRLGLRFSTSSRVAVELLASQSHQQFGNMRKELPVYVRKT